MKRMKRFLAFFLTFCIALSMLPCGVLATDIEKGSDIPASVSLEDVGVPEEGFIPKGAMSCEGDENPQVTPYVPVENEDEAASNQTLTTFSVPYALSRRESGPVRYSVLVLDTSASSDFVENGQVFYTADTAIDYVKASAQKFVNDIRKASGTNYVALVEYKGTRSNTVSEFTTDYDALNEIIDGLYSSSNTRSVAYGLQNVNALLDTVSDPNAIKNVVLFTTGMTNEGPYNYTGRYDESTVGSNWRRIDTDVRLYAYSNSAIAEAETLKSKATLYSVGLFQVMENMPEAGRDVVEFFKLFAKDVATSEDYFYDVKDPSELEFVFGEIADDITKESGKFKYAGQINQKIDQEAIYYYDDSYFFRDADIYDRSLSTMSLCLELSSWSSSSANQTFLNSGDKGDKVYDKWYDPNVSESDPAFWKDTLVNVKTLLLGNPSAGEGYEGIGFHDFAANAYWESMPTKDSIGVVAARKQISAGEGEKEYTLVALVVRGGGYGSEWASNFTLGRSGEHEGFQKAKEDVLKFLGDYVSTLREDESKDLKLWVVGFSRGGITANMVTGELNKRSATLLPNTVSLKPEDTYCYAFEPPMGILDNQDDGTHTNIHNVVNQSDLVPLVAPDAWNFTRYNAGSDWALPVSVNNSKWNKQFGDMKQELIKLGYDPEFYYTIHDSYVLNQFNVDLNSWLPFGDPLWWNESEKRVTRDVINDGLTVLLDDFFQGRSYYATNTEHGIRQLSGLFFFYAGAVEGFNAYVAEVGSTTFTFDEFLDNLENLFTWDSMQYILQPAIKINFDSPTERVDKVKDRAKQKVLAVFGGIGDELAQMDIFVNAIGDGFGNLCGEFAKDVLGSNTQALNNTMNFIEILDIPTAFSGMITPGEEPPNQVFCAHYPEICLAWVRSQDPNYNTNVENTPTSSITRIIRINCPVDAMVYDSNGQLVASIQNDVAQDHGTSILSKVTSEGEKVFYLPGDADYRVKLSATGSGTVCYSVSEFNFMHNDTTRARYYFEIPVSTGDTLTGTVPKIMDDELVQNSETGSTVAYQLFNGNNTEISPSSEVVPENTYEVTVEKQSADGTVSDGEIIGGTVTGAGTFLENDFAKIMAKPLPGSEFRGFIVNGVEVRDVTEETHSGSIWYVTRFRVSSDTTVVAKFEDVTLHTLSFQSGVGGKVTNEDGYFCSGMTIHLQAVPNPGYKFAGWKSSNGASIVDATIAETEFVMPDSDVILTASFVRDGTGSVTKSYPIIVEKTYDGTITSSHTRAAKGNTITLTATADKGYALDSLLVTDKNGAPVKLTEKDGKFTFTMPASKVFVEGTFVENKRDNPFVDVPDDAYYNDAVIWAVENGITTGVSATIFNPDGVCTRAQAVTFLWRAAGSPVAKFSSMPFTDVATNAYYYDAVLWAVENGITFGTSDTTFSPNATCNRAQIVTFLWRSEGSEDIDTTNPFTDVDETAYYADAVLWAVKNGVTVGTSATTFAPDDNCTRAQIVTFIWRASAE